ncbi:hypothetical protein ISCGN_015066 [Ixodes scapularis]
MPTESMNAVEDRRLRYVWWRIIAASRHFETAATAALLALLVAVSPEESLIFGSVWSAPEQREGEKEKQEGKDHDHVVVSVSLVWPDTLRAAPLLNAIPRVRYRSETAAALHFVRGEIVRRRGSH